MDEMCTALLLCPCAQGHSELCVLLICVLGSPEKVPEGLKTVLIHQLRSVSHFSREAEILPHLAVSRASLKGMLAWDLE